MGQTIAFRRRSSRVAAMFFAFALTAASARDRIAQIEFFGYQGIDIEAIRKELPVHEGDALVRGTSAVLRAAVKRITGSDPTDVAAICCINDGDTVIFIGLAGKSSRPFALHPRPAADLRLSSESRMLMRAMDDAEAASADNSEVDKPAGYRLMKDVRAQAAELKVRGYARGHSEELIRVLANSAHADERAWAADALGYADRSREQIDALVIAAHDSNDEVRNNATRALSEILDGDESAVWMIPASPFIEMLHSGTWTDRNKAASVVSSLTKSRDVGSLGTIKARAWDALLEMARWRHNGWSGSARMILARIAGIPEDRAQWLSFGTPEAFLEAIGAK
ncbi:MAG TPA: HEAT repeat domain-containing protein [Candidatus Solibacter sp.]|nr:HEAT repeat domain-containing protein [Candidatus Solibacter sp.]